jgi:hypothetical protein
MPTEKQQWLDKYDTYHAATEYNRQHYGKRIKQLKKMLEDEKFLEFLSSNECKQDALLFLAKSNEFDMYIAFNEQGEAYIHDHDFGLINHMKKMLRVLQSEHFIKNSTSRPQAKRYVEMYLWYDKDPIDKLPELPF